MLPNLHPAIVHSPPGLLPLAFLSDLVAALWHPSLQSGL